MGQVLHGSATTTEAVRRAIQNSQASLRALSKRYGIYPKTVAKWKRRSLGYRYEAARVAIEGASYAEIQSILGEARYRRGDRNFQLYPKRSI